MTHDRPELVVEPLVGVGTVRFGMSFQEVRDALGEPAEIQVDDEASPGDSDWYYPALGLQVCFSTDEQDRVTSLEIDHPDCLLKSRKVVGVPIDELLAWTAELVDGTPAVETIDEFETSYLIEAWECVFYAEKGTAISLQIGVALDPVTGEPLWP